MTIGGNGSGHLGINQICLTSCAGQGEEVGVEVSACLDWAFLS